MQEQASTLAIASSADTAKTGHGHALRANVRWCQGNLLGAYEDLHIAQQAMQTINSSYAINMSEVYSLLSFCHAYLCTSQVLC